MGEGSVDQLLKIFGVSAVLIVLGLVSNVIQFSDLILFAVLMAVTGVGWKLTQTDLLKKQLNQFSGDSSASGINYSYEEGKEFVDDFAKREFSGFSKKKGVSIDHTRSESEPTSIILDPQEGDVIQVRHYYVTHGDLNQPVDFFVDVTNGEYFAHKQVNERRRTANNVNPFEKLDAYRKTRRYARKVRPSDDNGVDASQLQGIPVGTFPVDNRGENTE